MGTGVSMRCDATGVAAHGNRPHPVFARMYERISRDADAAGAAEHRRRLLDGLSGRVGGAGGRNGRTSRPHPPAVTEALAIEPEPRLRAAAEREASGVTVPVRVQP